MTLVLMCDSGSTLSVFVHCLHYPLSIILLAMNVCGQYLCVDYWIAPSPNKLTVLGTWYLFYL